MLISELMAVTGPFLYDYSLRNRISELMVLSGVIFKFIRPTDVLTGPPAEIPILSQSYMSRLVYAAKMMVLIVTYFRDTVHDCYKG